MIDWPCAECGTASLDAHNPNHAFDTTKFNTVASQQLLDHIRTFPSMFSNLQADGPRNLDLNLLKDFQIKERFRLQFRFEAYNALNHPLFAAPDLIPTDASFGKATSQANISRFTQMSLRLTW